LNRREGGPADYLDAYQEAIVRFCELREAALAVCRKTSQGRRSGDSFLTRFDAITVRPLGSSANNRACGRCALINGRSARDRLAPGGRLPMRNMVAHRDGRFPFAGLHFLGGLGRAG